MKDLSIGMIQEYLDFSISITLLDTVKSTNTYLMDSSLKDPDSLSIVIARHQSEGYGRNKSKWISDYNAGIWMSIGTLTRETKGISSLSLAISAGLTEKLHLNGFTKIGLKWPNDFVCEGKKLGGIIIETKPIDRNFMKTIIGIGLNLDLPDIPKKKEKFGLEPISLNSLKKGTFDISYLIANLISSVNSTINKYKYSGFDSFARIWRRYDIYSGSYIQVESNNQKISGVNNSINDQGALIINNEKGSHKIYSGALTHIGSQG
tara:strand:- start:666 stop:1454 length:789 start_codon:yes stop_codon:yes gene_type:complete